MIIDAAGGCDGLWTIRYYADVIALYSEKIKQSLKRPLFSAAYRNLKINPSYMKSLDGRARRKSIPLTCSTPGDLGQMRCRPSWKSSYRSRLPFRVRKRPHTLIAQQSETELGSIGSKQPVPPETPETALDEAIVQLRKQCEGNNATGFKQMQKRNAIALELPPGINTPGRFALLVAYESFKAMNGARAKNRALKKCAVVLAIDDPTLKDATLAEAQHIFNEKRDSNDGVTLRTSTLQSLSLDKNEAAVVVVLDPAQLRDAASLVKSYPDKSCLINMTCEALGNDEIMQNVKVMYSFTPLAIKTLLGQKAGAVYLPSVEHEWLIFARDDKAGLYELAGRCPNGRPSQTDIEQSLYSNQAAKSPINQGLSRALSWVRSRMGQA